MTSVNSKIHTYGPQTVKGKMGLVDFGLNGPKVPQQSMMDAMKKNKQGGGAGGKGYNAM
jgi:hypothetical protein